MAGEAAPRRPGRPRLVDEAAVQDAALTLFAERGYRATTMADIGVALGVRGPSLYRHVRSKQDLLVQIMLETMKQLISEQQSARAAGGGPVQQLRRMVEAHVRFHATHREQAFVGNREIDSLEPAARGQLVRLRRRYEQGLREVIGHGAEAGLFDGRRARLASYAILDMGMGVAAWFRSDGPHTPDEIAYAHADFALALLAARTRSTGAK